MNYVKHTVLPLIFMLPFIISCDDNEKGTPQNIYSVEASESIVYFNETGGSKTLIINTNSQWQINTNSEWVRFTPFVSNEKADSQIITIMVPPFGSENDTRSDIISIKCGNLATDAVVRKFITIIQNGPVVEDRSPGIYSPNDLIKFGEEVVKADPDYGQWADENGVIQLMNDIDFGSILIPPIGGQSDDVSTAFAGTFEGNGFTIKGTIDGTDKPYTALFSQLAPTGIIRNLTVDAIVANGYTGTIQRHAAAIVGFGYVATTGYIENCIAKGTVTLTGTHTNPRVGGIAAYVRCPVRDCINYAAISSNSNRVAGIVGAGSAVTVMNNCINYGDINVNCSAAQVGGIIGQSQASITDCVNNGKITATSDGATQVGGIAGQAQNANQIKSCTNNGEIILNKATEIPANTCGAGGIAGTINNASFSFIDCINNGKVTSNVDHTNVSIGGILGTATVAGSISNCENTSTAVISSAANAGGIIGRTSAANILTNCKNAGAINILTGSTIPAIYFGCMTGQGNLVTFINCVYGGSVNNAPGSEANAKGNG